MEYLQLELRQEVCWQTERQVKQFTGGDVELEPGWAAETNDSIAQRP